VTVFHPAGIAEEVDVKLEVGLAVDGVASEHAAKLTQQTIVTPTDIHRINPFDVRDLWFVPSRVDRTPSTGLTRLIGSWTALTVGDQPAMQR
jgi:hypothetical protein